jgi:hypothetical protein
VRALGSGTDVIITSVLLVEVYRTKVTLLLRYTADLVFIPIYGGLPSTAEPNLLARHVRLNVFYIIM